MNKKLISLAIFSLLSATVQVAFANVIEVEPNDTLATAQDLGSLPNGTVLSVILDGEISTITDVDFFKLTLPQATGGVYDIDLANDFICADPTYGTIVCGPGNEDPDVGVDANLAVFDSTGTLIAYNDDSDLDEIDPGSLPYGDLDPYISTLTLPSGTYYFAIAGFGNMPNALPNPLNPGGGQSNIDFFDLDASGALVLNATPDSTYFIDGGDTGPYQFVASVTVVPTAVPVPAALWLFASGLAGLLGFGARRKG